MATLGGHASGHLVGLRSFGGASAALSGLGPPSGVNGQSYYRATAGMGNRFTATARNVYLYYRATATFLWVDAGAITCLSCCPTQTPQLPHYRDIPAPATARPRHAGTTYRLPRTIAVYRYRATAGMR